MKVLIVLALCAAAVLAVPNGRRLRPEEHWRPARARDLSKYKPRTATVPRASTMERPAPRKVSPSKSSIITPSIYNLAEECGVEGPAALDRIVGGTEATPHQYPWIVALFVDDAWFCGGSLISEKWVLTAAHCVDGASYFDIMAGAHNVRASSEPNRVEITSYNGFTHENWDSFNLENDIALIELPSAIKFNDYISPSCLPAKGDALNAGDIVSVIGWGKDSDSSSSISAVLRQVHDMPCISNKECNDVYGIVGAGIVCIDTTGGKSSCNGDSGGPLIQKASSKAAGQKWTQVGVVSFGSSGGCEIEYPAGYTRTEYYLDWIASNTKIQY